MLPNNIKDAKKALIEEVASRVRGISYAGKVWERIRYADNLKEWRGIAADLGITGKERLNCVFLYMQTFRGEKDTARNKLITLTIAAEVIQQFYDGTAEDNSTIAFDGFCADFMEAFLDEDSLGMTDASGAGVLNTIPDGGESDGKPALVDGLLAHRRVITFEIKFRRCKA